MLGLFWLLPVLAVHAPQLAGGDSQALVGLALGTYGLTQVILQIPYGMASDRYGRKRVIVIGLLLFALGRFVAAWAPQDRKSTPRNSRPSLTSSPAFCLTKKKSRSSTSLHEA